MGLRVDASVRVPGADGAGVERRLARAEQRRWLLQLWLARVGVGAALIIGWQLLDRWLGGGSFVSSPGQVGQRLVEMTASGELAMHVWATMHVALLGLLLGMLVGVAAGLVLGLAPRVGTVLEPFVMIFYTLPRIALAPLFIMYLGIGMVSKVALAFTIVVFVALLSIYQGVRTVDRDLLDGLRTMRATRGQLIRWVVLPSITPWVFATLRIGIGLALIGAIVAEFIASSRGLGWYMQYSAGVFDITGVFTGIVVFAVLAALANGIVALAERRLLAWRGG